MSSHAYRLKSEEQPAAGLRRIALGRAEKAEARLQGAREGELAPAIHGARKDLKKLRGVLRLVRKELGRKAFEAENKRYRDAGRLLAGSRDAEVKLETLAALRSRFDQLPADPAERWAGALKAERNELAATIHDEAEGKIGQAREAIEQGCVKIRGWSLRTDSWALVEPGLLRSYRDGRRAMKRVLASPSADSIHAWRKRVKDIWYQLRILQGAWPELLGAAAAQASELADLLGDHHDLAVLQEDLLAREGLADRDAFTAAIAARQAELLAAAIAIGRRLYAEKPKAFGRRVERYWLAWRGD